MVQVIGVDDWIVQWVGRVDVDLAVTVRMLEGRANIDSAIEIVPNQEFNLTNGACKDSVDSCVVDGSIAGYDSGIGASTCGISVKLSQDAGLQAA